MLPQLAATASKPIAEGMSNVDVSNNFAEATAHSSQTGGAGSQGHLAWLSKAQNAAGHLQSLGKWNRQTTVDWGNGENTSAIPQAQRAQPAGM